MKIKQKKKSRFYFGEFWVIKKIAPNAKMFCPNGKFLPNLVALKLSFRTLSAVVLFVGLVQTATYNKSLKTDYGLHRTFGYLVAKIYAT
jgi:hypothetical protein